MVENEKILVLDVSIENTKIYRLNYKDFIKVIYQRLQNDSFPFKAMKMTYAAQTLLTTYSGRRNVSQSCDIVDEYLFELRCLILY